MADPAKLPTLAELDKKHAEEFQKIPADELGKMQKEFVANLFDDVKPEPPKDEAADKDAKPPEATTEPDKDKKTEGEKKTGQTEPDKNKKAEPEKDAPNPLLESTAAPEQAPEETEPEIKIDIPEAKQPEKEPVVPDEDLEPEDLEELEAAGWLAQNNPKYKGRDLQKELRSYWAKEDTYAEAWEKENKGEKFDPEAPEHREWYRKNMPLEARELEGALKIVAEDRVAAAAEERAMAKVAPEIEQIRYERAREKAEPIIEANAKAAVADLVARVKPDAMPEGQKILTKEIVTKLEKEDPAIYGLLTEEAEILRAQITELERLTRLGQYENPDINKRVKLKASGRTIMPLADVGAAGAEFEQIILKRPLEQRKDDQNRTFAPRKSFNEAYSKVMNSDLPAQKKQAKIAELESKYWTLQPSDIAEFLIQRSAQRVKNIADRIPASAKKTDTSADNAQQTKTAAPAAKPAATAPPSTVTSSDTVDTKVLPDTAKDDSLKTIRTAMW